MIRPSPNEFDRLKNEEFIKRRILRLKEVREHSKNNASKLRNLYKEQKSKVLTKLAKNIQKQINSEDQKKLDDLKSKYEKQYDALGGAHSNAADWVDPVILLQQKVENNVIVAQERHEMAVNQLKVNKEEKEMTRNTRLNALNLAMAIEKERAAAISSLPVSVAPFYAQDYMNDMENMTPRVKVCDKNRFSVIESYEIGSYNVERVTDDSQRFNYNVNNAMNAGDIRQKQLLQMNFDLQMKSEEKSIIAQLRGHQAIKKQIVQKDYGELLTNLEHISKSEMAKRQREYHQNEFVGPNSAGYLGMGHMAAMMGYKERCRERAVESAVMQSLKDITNNTSSKQSNIIVESNAPGESKLSKLYNIIKKQKENVSFETSDQNKNLALSSEEVNIERGTQPNIMIDHSKANDVTKDIIRESVTASLKSNSVMEKSNKEREIFNLEKTIEHLDRRLEEIKERDECSNSVVSDVHDERIPLPRGYSKDQSQESCEVLSSESVCSDSLNIIREFQRNALMKLSGYHGTQHSTNTLCSLNRDFAHISLDSTSVSERSTDIRHKDEISSSSGGKSSVSEWVKSQLMQTIDKMPDWVTRGGPEDQFLPDLNMSFMSSILNIRSEGSSLKDDIHSSCSTLLTRSSIITLAGPSSITEISKMGNDERCTSVLNDPSEYGTEVYSRLERSGSSMQVNDLYALKDEGQKEMKVFQEIENIFETRACFSEDLINFESVEDLTECNLTKVQNEDDISYSKALHELLNIAQTSHSCCYDVESPYDENITAQLPLPCDNASEERTEFTEMSNFVHIVRNEPAYGQKVFIPQDENVMEHDLSMSAQDWEDSKVFCCESPKSHTNDFSSDKGQLLLESVNLDLDPQSEDKSLISDYEKFLRGLVNIPFIIPSSPLNALNDTDNFDNSISSFVDVPMTESTEGQREVGSEESCNVIIRSSSQKKVTNDIKDHCSSTSENREISYFTSTTKESQSNLITISLSPIERPNVDQEEILSNSQHVSKEFHLENQDMFSQNSLEPLSPYVSETSEKILNDNDVRPFSVRNFEESISVNIEVQEINKKKMKNLLSSTMKPDKGNLKVLSPDVSSISSISVEACSLLKQRIMQEYFEKNKNNILAGLPSTESSGLSLKPMESYDDSTPRNLDSGKPSSRLTIENSEINTGRFTNEDIFITPRNDTNLTEYTPRDEWSTSHTNFQVLSDYVSTVNKSLERVDLDETLKDIDNGSQDLENRESLNLINFNSTDDLNEDMHVQYQGTQGNNSRDRLSSPCLSEESDFHSYNYTSNEESIPSKESSDRTMSSFHILTSYHSSSSGLPLHQLNIEDIHEFELPNYASVDSKSDADISSVSLASFLKNESLCQQPDLADILQTRESTSKHKSVLNKSIDNNEEMKNKLAQWKKERLTRVNQNILELEKIKSSHLTKTSINRKEDEVTNKSRTLRLYNNLEEVQKMNQKKEAEQRMIENQFKKKEYAERLRKIKKEKVHGKG